MAINHGTGESEKRDILSVRVMHKEQEMRKSVYYRKENKGEIKMAITDFSKEYHERMLSGYESKFLETDPEFIELFDNFAFDEVVNQDDLDDRTRMMAIIATLVGCQGIDEFKAIVPAALNFGVTPVEVKEVVYQAVAYLGIGRVFPFLYGVNEILIARGIKLPLEGQSKTTRENRLEKGIQAQVDIFGDRMKDFYKSGPEESRHINHWLADNCFGDYYTRSGLDYKQREMITFCFLSSQGGCEPQLTSHAAANMRIGNDKQFLIKIISQCLPFIGYPRSLNALRCVNDAAAQIEK
ncbi:Carboxymuconolactone decarboxylase [Clostridium sp. DL-VIII]|nr:Carboxymuconolactone decarboxylase [Clostridium sp. DL-VIII]